MRIAFVDDEPEIYPVVYGGKATAIASMARALAKHPAINEVVVCSRSIRPAGATFVADGVQYRHLDGYGLPTALAGMTTAYDIVSVHTCSYTFPSVLWATSRIVYHLHDTIFATADRGSHLDKALGGTWSGVIAPSDFAARTLMNVGWWSPIAARILTVPRGVDTEVFSPVPRDVARLEIASRWPVVGEALSRCHPVLLFPSRPTPEKGGLLLDALVPKLREVWREPLVITTGAGRQAPGIADVDWLTAGALRLFYSACDAVLVLSLLPESFNQVALQAVLCECPVVCTRFGNLAELADTIPGFVSAEPVPTSIADAVETALAVPPAQLAEARAIVSDRYELHARTNEFLEQVLVLGAPGAMEDVAASHLTPRYFTSPVVAWYRDRAFVSVGRAARPVELTHPDQELLAFCASAKTPGDLAAAFPHINEPALAKTIASLVGDGLLTGGPWPTLSQSL